MVLRAIGGNVRTTAEFCDRPRALTCLYAQPNMRGVESNKPAKPYVCFLALARIQAVNVASSISREARLRTACAASSSDAMKR
jgi:hypothetical protein